MKNLKRYIFLLLIFIFLANIIFRVFSYKSEYQTRYDKNYWKNRYDKSQWTTQVGCGDFDPHVNPKTCVWDDAWYQSRGKLSIEKKQETIGDDGLYAYAGWEYVNGRDPTLLNAEMPPFGKYLIGLSILSFGNQNIFALLSGLLSLVGVFLLGKKILKDSFLAFIPVLLFSFEPLFYTQLRAPYLDLLYLSMLTFTFYFFLGKKIYISSLFLGLMMATKASVVSLACVSVTIGAYLVLARDFKLLKKWMISLPIALLIFCLAYLRYFFLGNNLIDFLKVQKWIIHFYSTGAKGSVGSVFEMFFLGQWPTWFGKTVKIEEWSIIWPVLFILAIVFLIIHLRKRDFNNGFLLLIWIAVYFTFLLTVPVFPRYFLLILPFLYIIAVDLAKSLRLKQLK